MLIFVYSGKRRYFQGAKVVHRACQCTTSRRSMYCLDTLKSAPPLQVSVAAFSYFRKNGQFASFSAPLNYHLDTILFFTCYEVDKNPRTAPFHYPHKAAVAVYGLVVQGVSSGRKSAGVKIHLSHGYMIGL